MKLTTRETVKRRGGVGRYDNEERVAGERERERKREREREGESQPAVSSLFSSASDSRHAIWWVRQIGRCFSLSLALPKSAGAGH